MEKSIFTIKGMTCQACVKAITEKISAVSGVTRVIVSLENKNVEVLSDKKIGLREISEALLNLPKYKVSQVTNQEVQSVSLFATKKESMLKTYRPLITVFIFIIIISLAFQMSQEFFQPHLFMNHIMAGFFVGFSFFKFLDLKAFAESFSSYDPLAQKWPLYGYVYPFIELALGFLFVANTALPLANTMTVIVLSLTTIGVYKRLQSKSQFQCACLGTTFNLPLSYVTIFENTAMILMGIYGLFLR